MPDLIPPLARYFELTTRYGAPTAAGPSAGSPHTAIDFGAPFDEPVFSMGSGVVLAPNGNPDGVTGGNTITIDYGDGIIASFAHLNRMLVKPGDRVGQGQPIGTVGNTGITTGRGGTSGAHLHLDTWRNGRKVNPLDLFDWTRETIDPADYGGVELDSITEWLKGGFSDDIEAGKTWGDYTQEAFGFIGAPISGPEFSAVIESLGWQDRKITASDYPRFALEFVALGGSGKAPWDVVGDWGKAITDFVAAILNPETWARVAAMLLGFVMAAVGTYMIWSAT